MRFHFEQIFPKCVLKWSNSSLKRPGDFPPQRWMQMNVCHSGLTPHARRMPRRRSHCMPGTIRRWSLAPQALVVCVCVWLHVLMTERPCVFISPGPVCASMAVCIRGLAWVCVLLHVHQRSCLLSVRIRRPVFFPLNHWWGCNSNAGPPISSPTSCHRVSLPPSAAYRKTSRLLWRSTDSGPALETAKKRKKKRNSNR